MLRLAKHLLRALRFGVLAEWEGSTDQVSSPGGCHLVRGTDDSDKQMSNMLSEGRG